MLVSIRLWSSLSLQCGLHPAPWREMMGVGACSSHLPAPTPECCVGPKAPVHSAPRVLVSETDRQGFFPWGACPPACAHPALPMGAVQPLTGHPGGGVLGRGTRIPTGTERRPVPRYTRFNLSPWWSKKSLFNPKRDGPAACSSQAGLGMPKESPQCSPSPPAGGT